MNIIIGFENRKMVDQLLKEKLPGGMSINVPHLKEIGLFGIGLGVGAGIGAGVGWSVCYQKCVPFIKEVSGTVNDIWSKSSNFRYDILEYKHPYDNQYLPVHKALIVLLEKMWAFRLFKSTISLNKVLMVIVPTVAVLVSGGIVTNILKHVLGRFHRCKGEAAGTGTGICY